MDCITTRSIELLEDQIKLEENTDDKIENSEFISRGEPPACDNAGSPLPEFVPTVDLDTYNLTLLKNTIITASSTIAGYPGRHSKTYINDGWYNNCRSWIPAQMPATVHVDLGKKYNIFYLKFGSEHQKHYNDRAATKFNIQVSTDNQTWVNVYNYDNQQPIRDTTLFELNKPENARYVKIYIKASVGGKVRIDELEIWGKPI